MNPRSCVLCVTAVAALGLLAACAPPAGALVYGCEDHPLSSVNAWTCTVSSQRLEALQYAYFETKSPNAKAVVTLRLHLAKGKAHVTLGEKKEGDWTVEAGTPLSATLDVAVASSRKFPLTVEPVGPPVEGLAGSVDFTTP